MILHPVIDASVAVKWFLKHEIYALKANRLLESEQMLLVPDLIFPEIGSIVWKRVRKGEFPQEEAINIVSAIKLLGLQVHPSEALIVSAVKIACETGRTAYDSIYVALALQNDTVVVTADEKLRNGLQNTPYERHLLWIDDIDSGDIL